MEIPAWPKRRGDYFLRAGGAGPGDAGASLTCSGAMVLAGSLGLFPLSVWFIQVGWVAAVKETRSFLIFVFPRP